MKNVIELIRVSTEGQAADDRAGIPAQRAANRNTAAQYGLKIVDTIELIDVSGTAVLAEPEMQRLLRELVRPDIHGVVTREFSRLMRPDNYADYAILQTFRETDTILYLPEGPLDLSSDSGRLMGTIRAAMAGHELSVIRERMMGGKEAMRRLGRWPAADHLLPMGVGYIRKENKFFYKPEAAKIREMFRKFLAGETNYDALARFLGRARGTVTNLLRNPIYTGWLVYDTKRDMSLNGRKGHNTRDRRKVKRAPEETYRHKVIAEGLVSEADFDRVQAMMAQKADTSLRQRQRIGQFTYNGFLWCAKCGARLHTFRNQFNRFYYICSNKKRKDATGKRLCEYTGFLNRDKTEAVLDKLVSQTLANPTALQRIYRAHMQQQEAQVPKRDRARLQAQVESLQAKRQRIIDAYLEGVLLKADRDARLQAIDRDVRAANTALAQQAPAPAWEPKMLAEIFAAFVGWPTLGRDEKRRLLHAITPAFHLADYAVQGLYLGVTAAGCNMGSPWKIPR
jgi:DNA invertase Pin-like site-specific DNA recombinase